MDYYNNNAKNLFAQYQRLKPEQVHKAWLHTLPSTPGLALDIGAGSGRDASWLAALGWQVTAIEPCHELRQLVSSHQNVQWLDDTLPALSELYRLKQIESSNRGPYQLILVSAVWMHLTTTQQHQSLTKLKGLLAQNGILVITWRNQGKDIERQFHSVDTAPFKGAAITTSTDEGKRDGVVWQCVVINAEQGTI